MHKFVYQALTAALLLSLGAANAQADDLLDADSSSNSFIFGVRAGSASMSYNDDADGATSEADIDGSVFAFHPFVGFAHDFNKTVGFRMELEYFQTGKADLNYNGDNLASLKVNGAFFNTSLVFLPKNVFSPYVGVGIGYSHFDDTQKNGYYSYELDSSSTSLDAFLGFDINFCDNFAFDVQGRFNMYSADIVSGEIMGGLKFSF